MKRSDSKTQENLRRAFLEESAAYAEYQFYAERAKSEGFEEIYRTLNNFANNEKAHAEIWFKLYHGIANTKDNLSAAKDLENYERTVMYADFSKVAEEEGFKDIARLFDMVGEIERSHEQTYTTLLEKVKKNEVFTSNDENTVWKCANCGNEYVGKDAPDTCPVCSHPQAYFYVKETPSRK